MPKMYGPSFDDKKETVNRDVPDEDVRAFENAGYQKGELPDAPTIKAGETTGTAEPDKATGSTKKGKLPEDFPGLAALDAASITTYAKVRKNLDSITEVPGVGAATADKIKAAMAESSPDQEEAE